MALLRDDDRQQLQQLFTERLEHPVTLRFYTQHQSPLALPGHECQTCHDTGALLDEVAALSDLLSVERRDFVKDAAEARERGIERIPAIVFEGRAGGTVRYFGVPAGYEFGVLIGAVVDVSRGTTSLAPATRDQLAALAKPIHLEVLVTPT